MLSVFNSLSVLLVLISSRQVEPAPTLITLPSNSSLVDEGSDITLRWTYNVDGTFKRATFKRLPELIVTEKDSSGLFVGPFYVNRIQVNISDGGTTITLLGMNSSESGVYNFEVVNTVRETTNRDVKITVLVPPRITFISPDQMTNESAELNPMCTASGTPEPVRTWTKLSDGKEVIFPFNITGKGDEGFYRCTANNSVGDPVSSDVYITVEYFHPINTNLSTNLRNMTVLVNTSFNLICSALANPPADYRFFKGESSINTTDSDTYTTSVGIRVHQVNYSCTPFNFYGSGREKTITVTVHFSPNITDISRDEKVNEGATVTLSCTADGNPAPTITWTRANNAVVNTNALTLTDISRQENGTYRCTATNGVGSPVTKDVLIIVRFLEAKRVDRFHNVVIGASINLSCPIEGNPEPTNFTFYKRQEARGEPRIESIDTPEYVTWSHGKTLIFKRIEEVNLGCYTCSARNSLGMANVTQCLKREEEPTVKATLSARPRGIRKTTWRITLTISDEDCNDKKLVERFRPEVRRPLARLGVTAVEVTIRCGSVIVDLVLRFNQTVSENDVITTLKTAAEDNQFGGFKVDPGSIKVIPDDEEGSDCEESFFKDTSCSIKLTVAIGISVAAVVLIVITAAAVGYWIHKKRKCRKDTRIAHEPGCEEQRLRGDDPYAQVNNGYAETGPRSVNSREKGAAAVPDYAVVDKSAKKKKKKKQDEEKPPEYAVVDKSKKTKKNEKGDDTYAKVDMSKKTSKKKRNPGEEMLYADLGDFSGASQMPTVATSPKAQAQLPPIKRPESYEGTQYADITQFLKGDATLPIDDKQGGQQGAELKEKEGKTDGAGGENAPKETPM